MADVTPLLRLSALGIYIHAIFISITLGFPLAIIAALYRYSKTGEEHYFEAARKMTVILAVNFSLGAITGTLVEFGLVQAWSGIIFAIASFVFTPLALELIAFANEIALLILFIATLGRIKPVKSAAILFLYWIFAALSGVLITTVNSWLVVPWGTGEVVRAIYPFMPVFGENAVDLEKLLALKILLLSGVPLHAITHHASEIGIVLKDPMVSLFSSYAIWSDVHNVTAGVIVGLAIAFTLWIARYSRSGDESNIAIAKSFFPILLVLMILQPTVFGHFMGEEVVKYNPTKFAMMENAKTTFSNPIVALLAYGNASHPIIGFDEFYRKCGQNNIKLGDFAGKVGLSADEVISTARVLNADVDEGRVNSVLQMNLRDICVADLRKAESRIQILHAMYYAKISAGVVAFLSTLALVPMLYNVPYISTLTRRIFGQRFFALAILLTVGVILAAILGWAVREVGRKPWTVYGLLYPEELVNVVGVVSTPAFAAFMAVIISAIAAFGLVAMTLLWRRW